MYQYDRSELFDVALPALCGAQGILCCASNAAEDQLAELARLVGSGATLSRQPQAAPSPVAAPLAVAPVAPPAPPSPVVPMTPDIEMVDSAPPLQFDLERELTRAFHGDRPAPIAEPVAPVSFQGLQPQVPVIPAEAVPEPVTQVVAEPAPMPRMADPEPDFSDMIADELDRALREEIAAEEAQNAQAHQAAMFAQMAAPQPVAAPPAPEIFTLDEPAAEPAPAPMPAFVTPEPEFDYSDPAAEFAAPSVDAEEQALRVPQVPPIAANENRGGGRKVAMVLLGVALLGATAAFGWSLLAPSGTAKVPTLLAETAPVKVKPKDAGGSVVPNQDRAVFKDVEGRNKPEPRQVALRDATEAPIAVSTTKVAPRIAPNGADAKSGERILAPKRVRTTVVRPDGTLVTNDAAPITTASLPITAPIIAPKPTGGYTAPSAAVQPAPVVVKPVRITAAPLRQTAPAAAPKPVAAKPVAVKPAAPKPVAKPKPVQTAVLPSVSSPYAVQISSQRSPDAARKTYATMSRRYAGIVGGKGVDIRKATVKGRDYYRVRIPAASRGEANTICSRLKSAGGDCFVTK